MPNSRQTLVCCGAGQVGEQGGGEWGGGLEVERERGGEFLGTLGPGNLTFVNSK